MQKIAFALPKTQFSAVFYDSNGVRYSAVIQTPRNNDELADIMLKKKVGMSQLRFVRAIGEVPQQKAAQKSQGTSRQSWVPDPETREYLVSNKQWLAFIPFN